MSKAFIVVEYTATVEYMDELGKRFGGDRWGNAKDEIVTGRFGTLREALDAVLRKILYSNQTIASVTWTAIDRPADGGDSVEYRTHFVSRACGTKNVYSVFASISKATFNAPSKADEKGLEGKAIRD